MIYSIFFVKQPLFILESFLDIRASRMSSLVMMMFYFEGDSHAFLNQFSEVESGIIRFMNYLILREG